MVANIIYNIFFHPLSNLPGPFFAKISSMPSFYHAYKGDRHIWLWQQFQIYGSRIRAAPNLVLFNSPTAYNAIYSFKSNVKRSSFYDAWGRNVDDVNVLMTSDTQLHARKRRLLSLAFTDHSVKASSPGTKFMAKHIDRWNKLLGGELNDQMEEGWSAPRDIATWANYLVFDLLGDLCFGADFKTKEPGENNLKKIVDAFDTFVTFNYPITKSPLLDTLVWLKPRGLNSIIERLAPQEIKDHYAFVELLVRSRMAAEEKRETEKSPVEREDMLHFLCSAKDPETGKPAFGFKELLAEANLLILAGSDTTAITISTVFFYICHDKRVYLKLVREIRSTFPNPEAIVHCPELLNCKYLRACIDETLRMAPAAPSELPREVLPGGVEIDGDHYPQGVIVGTPNWSMGRNEEHYGDAYTFRPERWIVSDDLDTLNTEEEVLRLKRGLHTFLRGPGDCIGQKLAVLELCMVIARTLWRFDVRLTPGTHVGEGHANLGWGCRDPKQFMLKDAYISMREGPMLQFKPR
ncbi:benzoate 4-monooxygenase cytochrome P450 [Lindgomyces ingoldianus]|uniref:Benzoate 4-monooxygenase cytochrome P450 n=1 Tax=Lindgomyces ingoldianus TaxID=673940 RepID=A0ACB6QDU0_9PLEO|nr:benzoate 4-monooxygenase cytochrome P450 [Lindgomyces ingoldianus]KAF2464532.1 benzoate 4-monooxygenase cytochrome P450 [Lindgomyces ingoldianus]